MFMVYNTSIKEFQPLKKRIEKPYRTSNGMTNKKIWGCIISDKLTLEKGKVACITFTIPIQVLINASKVLGIEKKKEVEKDLILTLAPPSGLRKSINTG